MFVHVYIYTHTYGFLGYCKPNSLSPRLWTESGASLDPTIAAEAHAVNAGGSGRGARTPWRAAPGAKSAGTAPGTKLLIGILSFEATKTPYIKPSSP